MNIYRSSTLILGLVIVILYEGFVQGNHLSRNNTVQSTRRRNRIQSNQIETTNRRTQTRPTDGSSRRRNGLEPIPQNRRRTSSRFSDLNTRQRNQPDRDSTRRGNLRNGRVSEINSRRRNLRNGETRQRNNRRRVDGVSRRRNREPNTRRRMTERTRSSDTRRAQTDVFNGIDSRNGQNDVLDIGPSRRGPNSPIERNSPRRVQSDIQNDIFNGIDSRNRQNDVLDRPLSRRRTNSPIERNSPRRMQSDVQTDVFNGIDSRNGQNDILDRPPSRRRPNRPIERNSPRRLQSDVQTDVFNGIDSRNGQSDILDRPPSRRGPNSPIDRNSPRQLQSDVQTDIFNGIDSRNGQNDILDRPSSIRGQNDFLDLPPSRRGTNSLVDSNSPSGIQNDPVSRQNGGTDGNRVILTRLQNGSVRNLLQNRGNGGRRGTPRLIGFLIPRANGRTQLRLMPGASRFLGNNRNNGSAVNSIVKTDQQTNRNTSLPFNLRTIISAAKRANLLPGPNADRSQRNRSPAVVVLRSRNTQNGPRNLERVGDSINNQISTDSQGIRTLGRDRSGQQPNDITRSRNAFNERMETPGNTRVNRRRNRNNQPNVGIDTFDTRIDNTVAENINVMIDSNLPQNDRFIETGMSNARRNNGFVNDNSLPRGSQASVEGLDLLPGFDGGRQLNVDNNFNQNDLISSVDTTFPVSNRGSGTINEPFNQGNVMRDRGSQILVNDQSQAGGEFFTQDISNTQPLDNMLLTNNIDQPASQFDGAAQTNSLDIQSQQPAIDAFVTSGSNQQDPIMSNTLQTGSQNSQRFDNTFRDAPLSDLPPTVPMGSKSSKIDQLLSSNSFQSIDVNSQFPIQNQDFQQIGIERLSNSPVENRENQIMQSIPDRSGIIASEIGSSSLLPNTNIDSTINTGTQQVFSEINQMNGLDVQGRVGTKMADVSQALPSQTSTLSQDKGQFNVSQEFNLQDRNVSGLPQQSIEVGIVLNIQNDSSILQNNTQSQSHVNLEQFKSPLPSVLSPTDIPLTNNNTLIYSTLVNASIITDANNTNIVNDQPINLNQQNASDISIKTSLNLPDGNMFNANGFERNSAQFTNMNARNLAMTNVFGQNDLGIQGIQQNRNFLQSPFIPTNQLQINERQQFINPRMHMPVIASQPHVGFPQTFTLDGRPAGFGMGNRNFGSANVNRMLGQFSTPVGNIRTQFVPVPVQISRFLPDGININSIQSRFQSQALHQQPPISALPSQSQTLNTIQNGIGKAQNISTSSQMNNILNSRQQPNVPALPPVFLGSSRNGLIQRFENNPASMSTTLGVATGQGIPLQGLAMNTDASQLGSTHFGGFGGRVPGIMLQRQTPNLKPLDQFGRIADADGLGIPPVPNAEKKQAGEAVVNSISNASPSGLQDSNIKANASGNTDIFPVNTASKPEINSVLVTQPGNKTTMDYSTLRTLISDVLNEFFTHQIAVKSPKLSHGTVVNTVAQAVIDARTQTTNLTKTNQQIESVVPASTLGDPLAELPIPPPVGVSVVTDVHNYSVLTNSSQDIFPIRPKKDFITVNSSHTSTNGSLGNVAIVTQSNPLVETGNATMNISTSAANETGSIVGNQPGTSNSLTAHTPFNINKGRDLLHDPVPSELLTTQAPTPKQSMVTTISPDTGTKFLTVTKLDTTLSPSEPITVSKNPSAGHMTTVGAHKLTSLKPIFDIFATPTLKPPQKEKTFFVPDVFTRKTDLPIIVPRDLILSQQTTPSALTYSSISNAIDSSIKTKAATPSDVGLNFVGSLLEQNVGNDLGNALPDVTVKDSRHFDVTLDSGGQMPSSITIGTSVFDAAVENNNAKTHLKGDQPSLQNDNLSRINQNDPNNVGGIFRSESNTANPLTSNTFPSANSATLGLPVQFESDIQQNTFDTLWDSAANRFGGNSLSRSFGTSNTELRRKQRTREITTRKGMKNMFPDSGPSTLSNLGVNIGLQTSRIPTAINDNSAKASTILAGPETKSISSNNGIIYSPSINTFKFTSSLSNNIPPLQNKPHQTKDSTTTASNLQSVGEPNSKNSNPTGDKFSSLLNSDPINLESAKGISSITSSSVLSSPNSKSISFVPSLPTEKVAPPPVPSTLSRLNKTSDVSFSGSVLLGSPAISTGAHFEYAVHPMHTMTEDRQAFVINRDLARNGIMTNAPRKVSRNNKESSLNFQSLSP